MFALDLRAYFCLKTLVWNENVADVREREDATILTLCNLVLIIAQTEAKNSIRNWGGGEFEQKQNRGMKESLDQKLSNTAYYHDYRRYKV